MNVKIEKITFLKIFGINLILFLLLVGLVYVNKTVLRPAFNESYLAQVITGSLPTFLAALLISLFVVNPVLIKKPRFGRFLVYLGSLGVMAVLIIDEFTSIGASVQYDLNDIIGSILGSLLAVLFYEYLRYRQILRYKNSVGLK